MKTLKITFAFLACLIAATTFGQEKPYFIIEESNGNYETFLKIDDSENIQSVKIEGYTSVSGQSKAVNVNFEADEVKNFSSDVAIINKFDINTEFAKYTVTVVDKSGKVITYPAVEISFQENLALAK